MKRTTELAAAVPFVELLAKSNFSFLQGASHPEELVETARELGYYGIGLCDSNGVYGIARGFQAAYNPSAFDQRHLHEDPEARQDPNLFRYLVGSELTPVDSSPVVLMPITKDGYARLCRMITKAQRHAGKGYTTLQLQDVLQAGGEADDLLCFPLPPWNPQQLERLCEVFADRLYLPVCKDYSWQSLQNFKQALYFEKQLGCKLFATSRPLYHVNDRKPLQDVLTCLLHKTTLSTGELFLGQNRERYLKSLPELQHLYRERPDLLQRTNEIAARVQFHLKELRYKYPQEAIPPGRSAPEFLRELVDKGLRWRYADSSADANSTIPAKALELAEHELALINELGYEDYFLTLWDICNFATREGILHQGRGSAANSIVCYAIGLTNVDPLRFQLMFERFISRERGEPPDIDIDFEHERREEVIQYIFKKYGAQHAAMVCNVICYRSRMAVREVAKVLDVPLLQINKLIKFMGREGLKNLVEQPVELGQFGISPQKFQLILRLAQELVGFPRHLGIHSGGFVISQNQITDIVPVEEATMDNRYVIQWNKDDVNTLGLMKIDVLALGMLTALQKCLQMLKAYKGIDWNLAQVPKEDPVTYQMIQKADTVGVFQIESRAQMSLLPRLKPKCFYDLVISVAIVRPGPIQGGMVHPFLRRRDGLEKVFYAHRKLVPILEKTMGVPLFQEQIMQVAVAVGGFTPGEADELRRIMSSSWTKPHLMEGMRQRLISGMLSNGISLPYAEQIHRTIQGFSSYGFPESHAASFAVLTYASCYLKCHHPEVFAAALLNSQPMGFYSPRQLINDAQRHGVQFLPLDIQSSEYEYTLSSFEDSEVGSITTRASVSGNDQSSIARLVPWRKDLQPIRVGFTSVYGLSRTAAETIVRERLAAGGRFASLQDFIVRVRLPRVILTRLAAAGAFQSFGLDVREALWNLQAVSLDENSFMFGHTRNASPDDLQAMEAALIPTESEWDSVQREYHTKGFSIDAHPVEIMRRALVQRASQSTRKEIFVKAKDLHLCGHGSKVQVLVLLSMIQKPPTAKGMCFLSVEDETGLINVVVDPNLYKHARLTILTSPLLVIHATTQKVPSTFCPAPPCAGPSGLTRGNGVHPFPCGSRRGKSLAVGADSAGTSVVTAADYFVEQTVTLKALNILVPGCEK